MPKYRGRYFPNGNAASPSIRVASELTGFYLDAAGKLRHSRLGVAGSYFTANGLASGDAGDAAKFLRGDGNWASVIAGGGDAMARDVAARAAGQRLYFNGLLGASMSIAAIRKNNLTAAFFGRLDTASLASAFGFLGCGAFNSYVDTATGLVLMWESFTLGPALPRNQQVFFAYTREKGTGRLYISAVEVANHADAVDITNPFVKIGAFHDHSAPWVGPLRPWVFNRAMTAGQLEALMFSGVPDPLDYNSADNVSLNTNPITDDGYDLDFSGVSATGATLRSSGVAACYAEPLLTVRKNERIGVYYDAAITSGAPFIQCLQPGVTTISNAANITAGVDQYAELLITANNSAAKIGFRTLAAAQFSIANVRIVRLGLLGAWDENALGCGPAWADNSGGKRDLYLPTDGESSVYWNVPAAAGGPFRYTRTSSGYLVADQVVIPAGCSVQVWAKGDGGTFSLGDSAGTPASIVNTQAAPAALSPIAQAGYVTANRKLYLTLGTAMTVTVRIEILKAP